MLCDICVLDTHKELVYYYNHLFYAHSKLGLTMDFGFVQYIKSVIFC